MVDKNDRRLACVCMCFLSLFRNRCVRVQQKLDGLVVFAFQVESNVLGVACLFRSCPMYSRRREPTREEKRTAIFCQTAAYRAFFRACFHCIRHRVYIRKLRTLRIY